MFKNRIKKKYNKLTAHWLGVGERLLNIFSKTPFQRLHQDVFLTSLLKTLFENFQQDTI